MSRRRFSTTYTPEMWLAERLGSLEDGLAYFRDLVAAHTYAETAEILDWSPHTVRMLAARIDARRPITGDPGSLILPPDAVYVPRGMEEVYWPPMRLVPTGRTEVCSDGSIGQWCAIF